MKAYSVSYKLVKSVFQNIEKCPSYDALNEVKYSIGHFWEAIQVI